MTLKTATLLAIIGSIVAPIMYLLFYWGVVQFNYSLPSGRLNKNIYFTITMFIQFVPVILFFSSIYSKQK